MTTRWQSLLVATLAVLLFVVAPFVYFRQVYANAKRFREVDPGRVYRSGQLTAEGFREAVARFGIRTIINLQDDNLDPQLRPGPLGGERIREAELCRQLGVRYVALSPTLIPRRRVGLDRPPVIDEFLALLDDPSAYPILLHCKAGLHRTGILTAIYRMEYQGWSRSLAFEELEGMGFGTFACTSANDYVHQYVLTYQPRVGRPQSSEVRAREVRSQRPSCRGQKSEVRSQKDDAKDHGPLTSDL